MALIGSTALTLADWAKRQDPDGKLSTIVELLSQSNQVLDDMLWIEGNLATGHRTTIRTGLPSATWRLLNYGVQPTKSTTAQVTDACGMLETYSEVDMKMLVLNGGSPEYLLGEAQAFIEGMTQQMAQAVFYASQASNPERITGFAPRFSTVNAANAQTANNVIDAGGVGGTNTSMWLVVWGPQTCHGIFPKNSKAGLQHKNLGEITKVLTDGSLLQVNREHFVWDAGLSVRDWRYIVRVCNIDVTLLNGGSAANLITLLIRAVNRLPTAPVGVNPNQSSDSPRVSGPMGRAVIYCNRIIRTYLDIQAVNKTNVLLQMEQWNGMSVTTFRGIPIRTVDAILNTEARVV